VKIQNRRHSFRQGGERLERAGGMGSGSGLKTPLLRNFLLKLIILPRQARDKHTENLREARFLIQIGDFGSHIFLNALAMHPGAFL
jgi:hypothetical protein